MKSLWLAALLLAPALTAQAPADGTVVGVGTAYFQDDVGNCFYPGHATLELSLADGSGEFLGLDNCSEFFYGNEFPADTCVRRSDGGYSCLHYYRGSAGYSLQVDPDGAYTWSAIWGTSGYWQYRFVGQFVIADTDSPAAPAPSGPSFMVAAAELTGHDGAAGCTANVTMHAFHAGSGSLAGLRSCAHGEDTMIHEYAERDCTIFESGAGVCATAYEEIGYCYYTTSMAWLVSGEVTVTDNQDDLNQGGCPDIERTYSGAMIARSPSI